MSLRIVAISGSLKKVNRTQQAVSIVQHYLVEKKHEVKMIDLASFSLPFVDERPAAEYPPEVQDLKNIVAAADGIILATPEYHNSLTGALKNAIDHLSEREFKGKPVALLSTAGGAVGVDSLNDMRLIMRSLHAVVIPRQVSIVHSSQQFDEEGKLKDKSLETRLFEMADELVRFATLFKSDMQTEVVRWTR